MAAIRSVPRSPPARCRATLPAASSGWTTSSPRSGAAAGGSSAPRVEDGALRMAEIERAVRPAVRLDGHVSAPGVVRLERRPADDPARAAGLRQRPGLERHQALDLPIAGRRARGRDRATTARLAVRVEAPGGASRSRSSALGPATSPRSPIHDRVLAGGPAVDPDYAARRARPVHRRRRVRHARPRRASAPRWAPAPRSPPAPTSSSPSSTAGSSPAPDSPAGDAAARGAGAARRRRTASRDGRRRPGRRDPGRRWARRSQAEGLHDRLAGEPRPPALGRRSPSAASPAPTARSSARPASAPGVDLAPTSTAATSSAARTWDSCFTAGFAQVAGGGSFRPRHRDRYRQWLTHKFGTWWDQFGTLRLRRLRPLHRLVPGRDRRPRGARRSSPAAAAPSGTGRRRPAASRRRCALGAWRRRAPPSVASGSDYVDRDASPRFDAETADTVDPPPRDRRTRRCSRRDPASSSWSPCPAFAIPPISISRIHPDGLELTIRAAGPATELPDPPPARRDARRCAGRSARPWPIEDAYGRDVAIVAGGIGLAPLRGAHRRSPRASRDRFASVRLYLGARTPRDRLFVAEMDALAARGRRHPRDRRPRRAGVARAASASSPSSSAARSRPARTSPRSSADPSG